LSTEKNQDVSQVHLKVCYSHYHILKFQNIEILLNTLEFSVNQTEYSSFGPLASMSAPFCDPKIGIRESPEIQVRELIIEEISKKK